MKGDTFIMMMAMAALLWAAPLLAKEEGEATSSGVRAAGPRIVESPAQVLDADDAQGAAEGQADEPAQPAAKRKVTYLGVVTRPTDETLRTQFDLGEGGVVVQHVVNDSPAAKAGLKPHDVITKVGDDAVLDQRQLGETIRSAKPGDTVKLTIIRGAQEQALEATLGESHLPNVTIRRIPFEQIAPDARLEQMQDIVRRMEDQLKDLPPGLEGHDLSKLMEQLHRELREMDGEREDRFGELDLNELRERMRQWKPIEPGAAGAQLRAEMSAAYSDREHTLKLTRKDGSKHLHATDRAGNVLFDGPVNTDAERAKVPEELLEKLHRLENQTKFDLRIRELRPRDEAPQDKQAESPPAA